MCKIQKINILIAFVFGVTSVMAQEKKSMDSVMMTEDVPIITLNTDKRLMSFVKFNDSQLEKFKDAKEKAKMAVEGVKDARNDLKKNKNKEKRGEYYGSKVKKAFIKKTRGKTTIVQKFTYLTDYQTPPKLITYKTYFFKKKQKIVATDKKDIAGAVLLHGKYTKTEIRRDRNGKMTKVVLDEGYYYRGVKNERWLKYNRDYVLIDKREYKKGIPADSKVTYHDDKKKKLKEILPIHNGFYDGDYFLFYPSGRIKMQGKYKEGYKIGKWREFYDAKMYRRERDTQYADKPFQDEIEPYIIREWDRKGKLTIDNRQR